MRFNSFTYGGEIISNMENVVSALFARAKNMTNKTEVDAATSGEAKKEDDKKDDKKVEEKKQ